MYYYFCFFLRWVYFYICMDLRLLNNEEWVLLLEFFQITVTCLNWRGVRDGGLENNRKIERQIQSETEKYVCLPNIKQDS